MAGEVEMSKGPKVGLNGFYIQMMFGGFSSRMIGRKR